MLNVALTDLPQAHRPQYILPVPVSVYFLKAQHSRMARQDTNAIALSDTHTALESCWQDSIIIKITAIVIVVVIIIIVAPQPVGRRR